MATGIGRIGLISKAAGFGLALGVFAITAPAVGFAAAEAPPQHIVVTLDKAKLVKLPEHVDTIVVGSPIVADVTMLKKNGLVVITGKGYGETNVIFLDNNGQALSEATITVNGPSNLLTVQRGLDRESYACDTRCEPTVVLGDANKYLTEASGQITSRNGLAAAH